MTAADKRALATARERGYIHEQLWWENRAWEAYVAWSLERIARAL